MAWSYTTGVLTSTGATEGAPDSLLAGIDIVEAADATRGYRDGFVAWLNNVRIVYVNSFVKVDDDATIEFRGSSYFASGGPVGFIGGKRAKLVMNTGSVPGVGTTTTTMGFMTGSTFVTERDKPNDPAFQIRYRNTARLDFPAVVNATQVLAKADIDGLDLYAGSLPVPNFFRMFFANATVSIIRDIRVFDSSTGFSESRPRGLNIFLLDGTYDALYREKNDFGSEFGVVNTVTLTRPTFYSTTALPLEGFIRSATFDVINPSFLNNCWNGSASFNSDNITVDSKLSLLYSYTNEFKQGLTALQGVNVRFTRAQQSVNGSPTWTAPGATFTASLDANGTFTPINLIDTYREGTSLTDLERFNWTAKARRYDRRTAGETVFENRVLYRHSVNMATGYSEEVQMLTVANLTLTEAQAAAITGIALAPSGATGGTVTVTGTVTASDLWHYYRQWIAQTANFDSQDTWSFDGATINIGAWNVVVDAGATLTGNLTTTGTVTTTGEFVGSYTDANGTVAPPKTVSITGVTAGSRLQIYNVTTATEIVNQIVAGTSYTATYSEGTGYSEGDVVRVRLAYDNGTTAKLPFSGQTVVGASGWSLLASQQDDAVYASLGIDGSGITEFTPDFPNVQVDINDPDGSTRVDRLYAWFVSEQSSEDGIRQWFGGIVPEDEANFRVITSTLDLKIDNVSATGVTFTDGRRLYRDDDASPLVASTTGGGSITFFAGKVYTSVVSTSSPVITGDIADVPSRVQQGMTAQGYTTARATGLDNLDAAVSSRNAVAPDNTGVAAIKSKTDNLPADPAGVSDLSGVSTSAQLTVVNEGVKKASLGIPHSEDI